MSDNRDITPVTKDFCEMRHKYLEDAFKDFKDSLNKIMLLVLATLLSVVGAAVSGLWK